jgi:isopenicillin-N epimerase
VRGHWLLEEGMTFVNHGSFGATPRRVLRAQERWRLELERQPLRFMIDTLTPALRSAASDLGVFVGADGADIAFVENATTGINAVLRSFELNAGDEVLTTSHVYGAVDKAITYVCRRSGAVPIQVEVPFPIDTAEKVLELIEGALNERTRLVVLDHITSPTALILPIEPVIELCRARDIPILIDGAHAPGMVDLDLNQLRPDWYTGNCHKWLCAPKGCAFLWANPDSEVSRDDIHPTVISHFLDQEWPMEFDFTGTRDNSAWLAVSEALLCHEELGGAHLRMRNHRLVLEGAALLCEALDLELQAPVSMLGTMVTLPLPGGYEGTEEEAQGRRRALWEEHRIEVAVFSFAGQLYFRISAQAYNDLDDYRRLADALALHRSD